MSYWVPPPSEIVVDFSINTVCLARFSKKATFDNNAFNVDGSAGCSLSNGDDAEIR